MPQLASAADTKYQLQLPKVSFRVVEDGKSLTLPAGVHSEQFRHFGYNDFSDFERPDYYIRYIEPIESELAKQVEYDMDEQDQEWLDAVNAERKKEQSGPIPYEVFEIIMDKLEKEWFALSKRIPQPASHMPVEDSKCAICDDGEGENSNAIVFCDGCNLAVHQDCYGVPYIPEGQWLCRKCTVSPGNPVSCLFCPNEGGAFKQTNTGHWSHLLCGMWISELFMGNVVYMEPVEGVEMIPRSRWKLVCVLCREKVGACIQCEKNTCFTAFHVTCARQMGWLQSLKSYRIEDGQLKGWCDKHLPDEYRKVDVLAPSDDESSYDPHDGHSPHPHARKSGVVIKKARGGNAHLHKKGASAIAALPSAVVTTKTARAHAKSYRPGPPIVPNVIVQSVTDYVAKINIRKRTGLVERVCRYWSLKREARRGAPLLKRLHLEPWTANSDPKQQTDAEKQLKLQFIAMLRSDLEKVRMLAEQVRKREKKKLAQAQVIKDVVDGFLFRGDGKLRLTLEKTSAMDKQELFLNPVSSRDVPDYHNVIKEPMCWLDIDAKLDKNEYTSVADFKRDVNLTLTNAMTYNAVDSAYHRAAKRIQTNAHPLLAELDSLGDGSDLLPVSSDASGEGEQRYDIAQQQGLVGDLEASLLHLHSLVQPPSDTRSGANDVLESLFKFELEPPKEPTPPPPSPKKRVKVSAADKKAKWEEREARHLERLAMRSVNGRGAGRLSGVGMAGEMGEGEGLEVAAEPEELKELPMPARTRGRRSAVAAELTAADGKRGAEAEAESAPSSKRQKVIDEAALAAARRQRGVVGLEAVPVMSDAERRRQEKALDIVIDQVDGLDQFKRFNVGWVLPEGSKRRRGAEVARDETPAASNASTRKGKERASIATDIDDTPLTSALPSSAPSGSTSRRGRNTSDSLPESPAPAPAPIPIPTPKRRGRPPKIRALEVVDAAVEPPPLSSPLSSALSDAILSPEQEERPTAQDDKEDMQGVEEDEMEVEVPEPVQTSEKGEEEQEQAVEAVEAVEKPKKKLGRPRKHPLPPPPPLQVPSTATDSVAAADGKGAPRAKRQKLRGEAELATLPAPTLGPEPRGRATRASLALGTPAPDIDTPALTPVPTPTPITGGTAAKIRSSTPRLTRGKSARDILAGDDGDDITPMASDEDVPLPVQPKGRDRAGRSEERASEVSQARPSGVIHAEGNAGHGQEEQPDDGEEEKDDPFPPFTLVWARQKSFPYFPAEVVDWQDDDGEQDVPDSVMDLLPDMTKERYWLIRFFDHQASYAWLPGSKLDMLGENDDIDQMYLNGKERGRTGMFKSANMKKAVQKGYREAMAMKALTDEE